MDLVRRRVEPDLWRQRRRSGGDRPLNGQLVITATPEMHTAIKALLEGLI